MHFPAFYRRRPQHVEAVQLTADNAEQVAAWCGGRLEHDGDGTLLWLRLGTSIVPARPGDWVARETCPVGVQPFGWFPIRSNFFDWAYEPAG